MDWIQTYLKRITYQNSKEFLASLNKAECFIITDDNLKNLYQKEVFSDINYVSIEAGEQAKTLTQVEIILERLLALNHSKNVIILGFGGGVVCDIAGFVSAIYKRGCNLALMPTSLIAMVDAAIGGKNGVNSHNFKNQFGTIKQADYINLDFDLLNTLVLSEIANGIAEMIKHGLIYSPEYYHKIINYDLTRDKLKTQITDYIKESINIKLSFVNGDERDGARRRILNFGHTLGHTIEILHNVPHGKAVLWGMLQALKLSYKLNMLSTEIFKEIYDDLTRFNIVNSSIIKWQEIATALLSDKKKEGDNITMILLEGIGKPVVKDVELDIIKEVVTQDVESLLRKS
ncbi:3-dehydroquinate synthase [bacterium]|nr:3-dehydroquinate synthase [bacterium]